ncbi:Geminin [Taenia crassiceps]|uniref:Geminin n=1 Tax=Taenia crassiceps TaxID=6207 RepID=A0ABR4Q8Y3_9CEST
MLVRRKGLSVRVDHAGNCETGELKRNSLKHVNGQKSVGGNDNKENSGIPLKTVKAPSLTIYKDTNLSFCQHCGLSRSDKPQEKASVSTQTTETTVAKLKDMLSGETPSIEYWMDLAEQRREALVETLSENKELCNLVEALQTEVTRLSKIEESLRRFMSDMKELDVESSKSLS